MMSMTGWAIICAAVGYLIGDVAGAAWAVLIGLIGPYVLGMLLEFWRTL